MEVSQMSSTVFVFFPEFWIQDTSLLPTPLSARFRWENDDDYNKEGNSTKKCTDIKCGFSPTSTYIDLHRKYYVFCV